MVYVKWKNFLKRIIESFGHTFKVSLYYIDNIILNYTLKLSKVLDIMTKTQKHLQIYEIELKIEYEKSRFRNLC